MNTHSCFFIHSSVFIIFSFTLKVIVWSNSKQPVYLLACLRESNMNLINVSCLICFFIEPLNNWPPQLQLRSIRSIFFHVLLSSLSLPLRHQTSWNICYDCSHMGQFCLEPTLPYGPSVFSFHRLSFQQFHISTSNEQEVRYRRGKT